MTTIVHRFVNTTLIMILLVTIRRPRWGGAQKLDLLRRQFHYAQPYSTPPMPPNPKPLRRQFLLRRQFHYAQPYSTPPMPPTPKPLRRRFHYAQPYSTPPMPPTQKPKGRRRQRDPQCRSAQEEAQPLNDPKQAHLVAYPASENISQIDSLELSSRLLSSEVACARVHCSSGQVELSLFKWPSHVAEPLFPTRP